MQWLQPTPVLLTEFGGSVSNEHRMLTPAQTRLLIGLVSAWPACASDEWQCCEGCTTKKVVDPSAPGDLTGVECVIGSVEFRGRSDLLDVADLQRVTGSVSIFENPDLASLDGLETLREVNGHFAVATNDGIEDLDALEGLESIGGELSIVDNGALRVASLAIEDVGGEVFIANDSNLSELTLDSLSSVYELNISTNPRLTNVSVPRLETVETIFLWDNPKIENLELPEKLETLDTLDLTNSAPRVLEGLEGLIHIQRLRLFDNAQLETVSAFGRLQSAQGISMYRNPLVADIEDFGDLAEVEIIALEENPSISDLKWLRAESVDAVRIIQNTSLTDEAIDEFLERTEIDSEKIGGNADHPDPYPDPCPWVGDQVCDGPDGNGLCISDPDCEAP